MSRIAIARIQRSAAPAALVAALLASVGCSGDQLADFPDKTAYVAYETIGATASLSVDIRLNDGNDCHHPAGVTATVNGLPLTPTDSNPCTLLPFWRDMPLETDAVTIEIADVSQTITLASRAITARHTVTPSAPVAADRPDDPSHPLDVELALDGPVMYHPLGATVARGDYDASLPTLQIAIASDPPRNGPPRLVVPLTQTAPDHLRLTLPSETELPRPASLILTASFTSALSALDTCEGVKSCDGVSVVSLPAIVIPMP
jgi:hypothetical protein